MSKASNQPDIPNVERHTPADDTAVAANLEELFARHHRAVYLAALRVLGNPADAEDVLQTVFGRLATQGDFDPERPWQAYLRRSAVNAAVDVLRSRSRTRWLRLDEAQEHELAASTESPEQATETAEGVQLLRRALAEERPRSAEMFVLRFFEGYENGEIAKLLGTTRATVAVTVHRVKNRLQKRIGGES